jgi:peptide/nickel transport system substrate-binding protein
MPDQPYWALDPQKDVESTALELLRCCLARTLFSYNGRPTDRGGTIVRPDLSVGKPLVSRDGLRWTFHLKRGIHYGPPLANVEVKAQDFIRALEREAKVGAFPVAYSFYFSVIQGFDEYAGGKADSISGLRAPDPHTLVVTLGHPEWDLDYLLSLPVTSPLPPNPSQPDASLGVATGHGAWCEGPWGNCEGGHVTYGRFIVSTGPYALAGSARMDFSPAPGAQEPISGYVPAPIDKEGRILHPGSITLVRNPSWRPGTDPLRKAYADRIEIALGVPLDRAAREVDRGRADMVFANYPDPIPQVRRYENDPQLRDRLHTNPRNGMRFISFTLALPPFDDIHVRRAVNYAIDKADLVRLDERSGDHPIPVFAVPASHMAPDSLENRLLLTYDPFATPGQRGSLRAAKEEMARSEYDRNHDGVCDVAACKNILAPVRSDVFSPAVAHLISRDLRPLGITLRTRMVDFDHYYDVLALDDATRAAPLGIGAGYAADYPSGSTWFVPMFSRGNLQSDTLFGATKEQLRGAGYRVRSVPHADGRIDACLRLPGSQQGSCWGHLDKYLMEKVVPWVPLIYDGTARTVSDRIAQMPLDQFANGMPALDQIALKPGSV